jgi:hypothetical protein
MNWSALNPEAIAEFRANGGKVAARRAIPVFAITRV